MGGGTRIFIAGKRSENRAVFGGPPRCDGAPGVPDVYRPSVPWAAPGSLGHPGLMLATSASCERAGQSSAAGVLCKQGVGGSSPLVSTEEAPGRTLYATAAASRRRSLSAGARAFVYLRKPPQRAEQGSERGIALPSLEFAHMFKGGTRRKTP